MPAGTCYASEPSVPSAGARGWAAGREGADEFPGRPDKLEPARTATPRPLAALPVWALGLAPHTCSSEGPVAGTCGAPKLCPLTGHCQPLHLPHSAMLEQSHPGVPSFLAQSSKHNFNLLKVKKITLSLIPPQAEHPCATPHFPCDDGSCRDCGGWQRSQEDL